MKRFFCSVCKTTKRVRTLPPNVLDASLGRVVDFIRIGQCRWHDSTDTRTVVNSRARIVAGLGSTRKTSASSAKTKSKK